MTIDIKKYQTKPARVDILVLTEKNVEEVANLMGCSKFDISKNLATGDLSVFFQFPTGVIPSSPHRYNFTATIGGILIYEYENEDPHWDLAPAELLNRLDPYEDESIPASHFNAPYDN